MRKLRERLSSKKGFTLVELIVVIVIILILAAVLIPNVMRYIGQARESAFQSEASGYLTEITGYEAEHFAKYGKDLLQSDNSTQFVATEPSPASTPGADGTGAKYVLSAFGTKVLKVTVKVGTSLHAAYTKDTGSLKKTITVTVNKGAVLAFSYCDGTYYVNWTQSKGWETVGKRTSTY